LIVNVSLYLRPSLTLNDFSVAANASNVEIANGIDLTVTNVTTVRLGAGSLNAESLFESRKTYIEVDAGSVTGEYGLYDILSIVTRAGSVKTDVLPKPADTHNPANAELHVSSEVGSININFPPEGAEIPERDYYTRISTSQGRICGSFLHGRNTSLSTHAGSIEAQLLPYAANLYNSTLSVVTGAGSQQIVLRSPYRDPGTAIKGLSSGHHTSVASLKLKYPPEWEGTITGMTTLGGLKLGGDGVRVIEEGRIGLAGRFVKAEKGEAEGSRLLFGSEVGSADVVVG